jgi:hypothetical protein
MVGRDSWIPGGRGDRDDSVGLVRLAGALMLTGSLFALPGALALEPLPAAREHLIAAAGAALALFFLVAPARLITRAWVYMAIGGGLVLIALAVRVLSHDIAFYYVVTTIFAALALKTRRELAVFVVAVTAALLAPLVYGDNPREQLHHILVTLPVLLISLFLVRYLRETLEARERTYREFAAEAVELAQRIQRGSTGARDTNDADDERRLDELAATAESDESDGR